MDCHFFECEREASHLLVVEDADEYKYCDEHIVDAQRDMDDTPMKYEVRSL